MNTINDLRKGFENAFIDGSVVSDPLCTPQFVSNNYKEGKKVFSSIEDELLSCDQFFISVAFITYGGIAPLLLTFEELEKKGVKGQILTTNYLYFSEPKALKELHEAKLNLDNHPLVREYLNAYAEVRELYGEINEILFSNFASNLCPKEK